MSFPLALIGGEEFADGFEDVHARLAEFAVNSRGLSKGQALKVVFLPTCAAHDGIETVEYWCEQARQRLGTLGAQVSALPVIDQVSADHPEHAGCIAEADWIYIGGGYPHVGLGILAGTRALEALHQARRNGALIAGASAGAMLLCDRSWVITPEFDESVTEMISLQANPDEWELPSPPFLDCLGFLPGTLLWPHFNQFFSLKWLEQGIVPPGITVIGVDEQTAVVRSEEDSMQVLGKGRVVIIDPDLRQQVYLDGARFSLNQVNA